MKKLEQQPNKQKAIDVALWRNFKHRVGGEKVGVIQSIEGDFIIIPPSHPTFKDEEFETLPADYSQMDYKHIRNMYTDVEILPHWEEIKGAFSNMDGELLRFILAHNIPIEKFIRYELACRGFNANHQWVGFKEAEKFWLK
ncbi:hypothetical protein MC378_12260 [Polaribacter sp. MSW13]|uniref:Uncharacterized protein n=1 Tax=Polaribacter marinus TaxID=2916838 RepID=A0A9X1VRW4_9FLAO|nr:hypothetical protein [Polaribacter marinus]MCI2229942.1 hypothetical protein [Polaribacter marinus]